MPGSYPDSSPSLSGSSNGAVSRSDETHSPGSWRLDDEGLKSRKNMSREFAATPPITPINTLNPDNGMPTPPSAKHERYLLNGSLSKLESNGTADPPTHLQPRTRGSAASMQYSPPTPEVTPPATLLVPYQHNLSRGSISTRAESFRTAREDVVSERGDDDRTDRYTGRQYAKLVPPAHLDGALSTTSMQKQRITNTTSKHQRSQMEEAQVSIDETNLGSQTPREEWAPHSMRNVTVRRKRLPRPMDVETSPINTDLSILLPPDVSTQTQYAYPNAAPNDQSQQRERHTTPPKPHLPIATVALAGHRSVSDGVMGRGLQNSPYRQAGHHRKVSEPSRLSNISSASVPYVEAFIIASPPRQPRTLRHVSKTASLRSSSGSVTPASPIPTASPADSETTFKSRRHSGRSSLGTDQTYGRPSTSSTAPSETSQTHLLYHGRDRSSLRYQAVKSSLRYTQNSAPLQYPSGESQEPLTQGNATSGASLARSDHGGVQSMDGLPKHGVTFDPIPKVVFKAATPINELTHEAAENSMHGAIIPESTGAMAFVRAQEKSSIASIPSIRSEGTHRLVLAPDQRASIESERGRLSMGSQRRLSITETPVSASGEFFARPSLDRIPTNSENVSGRQSFDRSSVATYEYGRPSIDRLTIRTEETGLARHMTPFSMISEFGDGLEVSEATAVSIYPHTNNSLLVVQQGSRVIQSSGPVRLNSVGVAGAEVLLRRTQPSTPPLQLITDPINVDSPLKNPRRPPEPPAIRITAATPGVELVSCPIDDLVGDSEPQSLIRRPTLTEKARRYSESVLQPIIVRTNSMRRSVIGSKGQGRHVSTSTATTRRDKSGNLHPFWQPKRFWDEDSEPDSDCDFGPLPVNDHDDESGGDEERLPPGGDTTELGEPRGIARIYDSFKHKRQNGAFLLGNTLGIERSGTNKRKPQIILPTELSRTASGRIVRRVESVGTLRSVLSSVSPSSAKPRQGKNASRPSATGVFKRSGSRRKSWRGLGLHVEWLGVAGLQEHMRERKREKRRDEIRKSIGTRYMVENAPLTN